MVARILYRTEVRQYRSKFGYNIFIVCLSYIYSILKVGKRGGNIVEIRKSIRTMPLCQQKTLCQKLRVILCHLVITWQYVMELATFLIVKHED